MNRRNLIKRCAQAALGIGAATIGVKAADGIVDVTRPRKREELHFFITPGSYKSFQDAVVKVIVDDVRRNGPTRDVIINAAGK